MTRQAAISRAVQELDSGTLHRDLSRRVAMPTVSQAPETRGTLVDCLDAEVGPALSALGFTSRVVLHDAWPFLLAERIEDPGLPTVLGYAHGDVVAGMDSGWIEGLSPWVMAEQDGTWFGRGTADNKGQHSINLAALQAVLGTRGRLGFNAKFLIEMGEEMGSPGLRAICTGHADFLRSDVLIASDGPRVDPAIPTIATGTRGTYHFDLVVKLRDGGVHSGHWGGLTTDPAVLLAHAISTMMDRNGKILVRDWLPRNGVPAEVRGVLAGCPVGGGEGAATIDPDWGEPGLTAAEKIYGWNSLIILAMVSGRPENPVNAVAPDARAHCQIRYTVDSDTEGFEAALRQHLDAHGLEAVKIENAFVRMAASRTAPDHPWVRWAQASMERSLGKAVQIIPNSSGGLPGDVFVDHLGVPLVWVPHSYNGCKQHGPDEHLLVAPAREGLLAFTGMWWDLGEAGTPG